MVSLEIWVHCGRGWVWLAWVPPAPGIALSERGELKTSPSALQCWSTEEHEAGYGEGTSLQGWGADGEEVGRLEGGLVLTRALWVRPGCG